MKFRWTLAPPQPVLAAFLSRELGVSPLLAQCLLNRGLSEPEPIRRFLQPRLKDLADPFLLPNMRTAVERLFTARDRGERLVIFGDYDVDGVTSTTLLSEVLTTLGWGVDAFLPHRMEEGYGLSQAGLEHCLRRFPVPLLLAVDCGSNSVESIRWLRERGVEVIVLDHHQVSQPLPEAVALVNPQLAAPGQPAFRELCSAGLAFKLAHALIKEGRARGLPGADAFDVRPLLDLVALGTIADLVPLTGENRILVHAGMERLNDTRRPGLIALKQVASIRGRAGAHEVGFALGPRLNAAGRLETAEAALRLMQARDLATAEPIARSLDACNQERRDLERSIAEEVMADLRARFQPERDLVLVEGRASWHLGVLGIVASRVLQEFNRPTLLVGGEGAEWRGSGRSIEGFDLAAALRDCDDLLVRHGGHAMAAGLTVKPEQLEALRARLNERARRLLQPDDFVRPLRLDAEAMPGDLGLEQVREIGGLQHTGIGNPEPRFVLRGVTHARPLQRLGAEKRHAKMWITDGRATREAVLWNCGDGPLPVGRFDLACVPQLNEWNGSVQVQLKVLDWQSAG
ncbi:MAG: single-stranded-DNA-specific exonuclease RecJ [Verrucomicrobiota bacterium]